MKNLILSYTCTIEAPIEEVCSFHTDTQNLPLITPPWIDVTIVSMDTPMKQNSQVELRIKRFGIPTLWKMKIDKLDCPHEVVDEMISGPFNHFRHERKFISLSDAVTQMDETITLELPFGFVGRLFFAFIQKDMNKMFAYRHQATKAYFKNKKDAMPIA